MQVARHSIVASQPDTRAGVATPSTIGQRAASAARGTVAAIGRVLHRALREFAWRRRVAATHRSLQSLDDRTLRDIGLHRSEIDSFLLDARRGEHSQRRARGRQGRAT